MPSFSGITVALQAMLSQQQAIDVINHNVSNANTAGYHRQSAVFTAGPTQGTPGLTNSTVISQIGSGVVLEQIKRFSDDFSDSRYRFETAQSSQWAIESSVMSQVQSTLGETSGSGLSDVLDSYWSAWKEVSTTPDDTSLRSALLEAGKTLASAFNTRFDNLTQIQGDLNDTVVQSTDEINTLATQIAQLNAQIGRYSSTSTQLNDFLDKQDSYIDRLSELTGAKITYEPNGQAMVSIGGHVLVQGTVTHTLTAVKNAANENLKDIEWSDGTAFNATSGSLAGVFEVRDQVIDAEKTKLNNLAATVFTTVNAIHSQGYGLDDPVDTSGSYVGRPFFVVNGSTSGSAASLKDIALSIRVNSDLDEVRNIAAGAQADTSGDGSIAEKIFLLQTNRNTAMMQVNANYVEGTTTTGSPATYLLNTSGSPIYENIDSYNNNRVTDFSLKLQRASTLEAQHKNLLDALVTDRESVNGVSLNEEAADLIKYQQAYNAATRMMTAIDDMLDRVINNMGRVGL
jgi:flagellar hook-associated protein 1